MPCYYPLDGYRSAKPNENGNYPIVFGKQGAQLDDPIRLPCGRCVGCRLERSRQWATRCMHESQGYDDNSFLTLTFNDDHVPKDYSIRKADVQKYIKRLRKRVHPLKVRYYACGEYGDENYRPHYHILLFNYQYPDLEADDQNHQGDNLFISELAQRDWPFGNVMIGQLTFESAAYVARYIMKKINGEEADEHYKRVNPLTGEITNVEPEFTLQSRKPAIGHHWYQKYKHDLRKGFITIKGKEIPFPKYYSGLLKGEEDPEIYEAVQERKRRSFDKDSEENQVHRLRIKEQIKEARTTQLKRQL